MTFEPNGSLMWYVPSQVPTAVSSQANVTEPRADRAMLTETSSPDHVIVRIQGSIGRIHLNRPKALNALSLEMVQAMSQALDAWLDVDAVQAVLVTGEGGRAFCAGGDVKAICEVAGKTGSRDQLQRDNVQPVPFLQQEYALNYRIANYPKPYLSYLDGITMGGGVGICIMGSHRVTSEHLTFAMPETAIGFFPDVGGSYFLSRLGPIGTLLALSGQPIDYRAACGLGIATHFIPRSNGGELIDLIAHRGIDHALSELAQDPSSSNELDAYLAVAETCFREDTVESIVEKLRRRAAGCPTAQSLLDLMAKRSPLSMKVALEQLRRGANMDFAECLKMEFTMSHQFIKRSDFAEGVRAVLVDKDHKPRWLHDQLEQVTRGEVLRCFERLDGIELSLPENV